jgi:hypothetical protein
MAYGIQVNSSSGIKQIDADYVNYQLVAEGTTTASSSNTYAALPNTMGVANYQVGDLVFMRPQAWPSSGTVTIAAGGIGYVYNNIRWANGLSWIQAGATYDYRIYRSATIRAASTGYGIEVYTSAGAVAFSSNAKNPRGIVYFEGTGLVYGSDTTIAAGLSTPPFVLINDLYMHKITAASTSGGGFGGGFGEDGPGFSTTIPGNKTRQAAYWKSNKTIGVGPSPADDSFDENPALVSETQPRFISFILP